MKHKKRIILICSLAVIFSLLLKPSVSQATDAIGGQVNTGGKIIFYEETGSTEESSSSEGTDSTEEISNSESEEETSFNSNTTQKPSGNFPSTGEIIQRAGPLAGIMLLFLLLFLLKRRKEKNS